LCVRNFSCGKILVTHFPLITLFPLLKKYPHARRAWSRGKWIKGMHRQPVTYWGYSQRWPQTLIRAWKVRSKVQTFIYIEPILIIRLILLQGHSFSVPDFEMIFSRKNIHLGVKFDGETEYKVKFRFHPETRKIADLLALLHASFQFCRWSIKNIRKDCQFANLGHIQALNCSCIFLPKMIRRTRKNR